MSVTDTSREAFHRLKEIGAKQQAVLGIIQNNGAICNYEIAHKLDWEINRVTPRVNELVDLGRVRIAFKDLGPTGRRVIFWETVPIQEKLLEVEPTKHWWQS